MSRPFTEEQVQRYSRHIILPNVGGAGQRKLLDSSVLVIGAGGPRPPPAAGLGGARGGGGGGRGPAHAARQLGARDRRRRARLARRDVPGGGRRGEAGDRRLRPRRASR